MEIYGLTLMNYTHTKVLLRRLQNTIVGQRKDLDNRGTAKGLSAASAILACLG